MTDQTGITAEKGSVEDELRKKANPNCKKCYGRGYIGTLKGNNGKTTIAGCKCAQRTIENTTSKKES